MNVTLFSIYIFIWKIFFPSICSSMMHYYFPWSFVHVACVWVFPNEHFFDIRTNVARRRSQNEKKKNYSNFSLFHFAIKNKSKHERNNNYECERVDVVFNISHGQTRQTHEQREMFNKLKTRFDVDFLALMLHKKLINWQRGLSYLWGEVSKNLGNLCQRVFFFLIFMWIPKWGKLFRYDWRQWKMLSQSWWAFPRFE